MYEEPKIKRTDKTEQMIIRVKTYMTEELKLDVDALPEYGEAYDKMLSDIKNKFFSGQGMEDVGNSAVMKLIEEVQKKS